MRDTPTRTDEQREALALTDEQSEAISHARHAGTHRDLEDLIARMVVDAEQRGRAEVSAAVEVVLEENSFFIPSEYEEDALVYEEAVRAALTDPAAAVARTNEETTIGDLHNE